jgi:two-component system sensor histidine kinase YesM
MIVMLLFFSLVPSLCIALVLYFTISNREHTRILHRAEETVNQMADELNLLLRKTEITAQTLSTDRTLRMAHNDFLTGISLSQEIDYYRQISDVLNWGMINQDLVNIRVYLPDSRLTTREQLSIFGLSMLGEDALPESLRTSHSLSGWIVSFGATDPRVPLSPLPRIVSYVYKIVFRSSSPGIILALDIETSRFTSILRAYEVQGHFRIIAPSGETAAEYRSGTGEKGLFISAPAGAWRVEALIPEEQFSMAGIYWWILAFGSLMVCGLLIPLAASLSAKRLVREIAGLIRAFGVIQDGQYHGIPVDGTTREVRFLQEVFNNMVRRIDVLINEVYAEQIALREVQLAKLYEQIKPHFLYNILESGKWMALKNNDRETSVFLEKLARMYRLGLSRGEDIVPLRQELEHIRLYLDLMPYRSRQPLNYREEADRELLEIPVIKLLLQPLVENAVEHGIRQRNGGGVIEVSARRDGKILEIRVDDNGKGLPEETLRKLNAGEDTGYGLGNVRNRLRLQYGKAYDLCFVNRESGGLRVIIRFPVS